MLLNAVPAIEALHPPGGIDQPLRTGIEGMAFRADLDADICHRRVRFEGIAAGASYHAAAVFWMNSSFHRTLSGGLHSGFKNIIAQPSAQFTSAGVMTRSPRREATDVRMAPALRLKPARVDGGGRPNNISIAYASCTRSSMGKSSHRFV